jgi:hypothetical protein
MLVHRQERGFAEAFSHMKFVFVDDDVVFRDLKIDLPLLTT